MSAVVPIDISDIAARASRALGKIDLYGPRGVTMVSTAEIEAMALLLAAFGLVPTIPGQVAPAQYFNLNQEVTK
jgi:hypothetical protein